MATRSRIEIDGINIYSHWDGYSNGMASKLVSTVENLHQVNKYYNEYSKKEIIDIKNVRFINAFIAGNKSNCELDICNEIGGEEYKYTIDSKKMSIKAYNISFGDDSENLFFNGCIFDFIKKYQYSHGDVTKKESALNGKKIYKLVEDIKYSDKQIISLISEENMVLMKEYYERYYQEFNDSNPNKAVYIKKLSDLYHAESI